MKQHARLLSITLLMGLITLGLPPAALPAAAAQPLTVLPAALSQTLQLGASTTIAVQVNNSGAAPTQAAIYEASAAPVQLQHGIPTGPARVELPAQTARIDPALSKAQSQAGDGATPFIIYLDDQVDLSPAYGVANWAERGRVVYELLHTHAERSQRDLRAMLRQRKIAFEPLWIVNAIVAQGNAADVQVISARPEVALLQADEQIAAPPVPPQTAAAIAAVTGCNSDQPTSTSCWNVRKIGADRVWRDFGVRGQGITVANIDTGVAVEHPALRASYRGYRGALPLVNDYNWYDPSDTLAAPADESGHGTHTMGTLAGSGSSIDQPAIGVAPGVRWIAARGCSISVCSESDLLRSAQWMLAPTDSAGTNPRPDLRPMIVNNSWGTDSGRNVYSGYVAAWRAAGIFPVFANGNTGLGRPPHVCGLVLAPAEYADVVGVGATDADDRIGSFSLYGPALDSDGERRLKPDFSAPGVGIVSASPSSMGYRTLSGTSMATPHVAGVVALLWSANPELIGDYEATYALLRDTAVRLNDTYCGDSTGGPNNIYGYGRIDAYAAVAHAQVDLPWLETSTSSLAVDVGSNATLTLTLDARRVPGPGVYQGRILLSADLTQLPTEIAVTLTVTPTPGQATLSGILRNSRTAAPIQGQVAVAGGPQVATNEAGAYQLTLPAGSYDIQAVALSHFSRSVAVSLTTDLTQDFVLNADLARIAVPTDTVPISVGLHASTIVTLTLHNDGTQPLVYSAEIPDSFYVVAHSERGGPAYRWVDLPADAVDISAQLTTMSASQAISLPFRLRFFKKSFTSVYIGRDGFLSFDPPDQEPQGVCLPFNGLPGALVAIFKADLDLSRGGSVRYAALGPDTWVVSYEEVMLAGSAGATYSFQAILRADGQIKLQYGDLGPLPEALALGVQAGESEAQSLGCRRQVSLTANQALTLRPQPPSFDWTLVRGRNGTLAPGRQANITVEVFPLDLQQSGQCGRDEQLVAELQLSSNDLERSQVTLPLAITRESRPNCHFLGLLRR